MRKINNFEKNRQMLQAWMIGLYNEVVGEIVSMTEESVVVERGDGEWEIVFYDRILTMNKI